MKKKVINFFRKQLRNFEQNGYITDLILCESRAVSTPVQYPKYVFDALKHRGAKVAELLKHKDSLFYSCGDIKYMSTALWKCLIEICIKYLGNILC